MPYEGLAVSALRAFEAAARKLGLKEEVLIENASSNLCEVIDRLRLGKKVLVIAGWGNNGADVLACARKLAARGYEARVAVIEEHRPNEYVCFQRTLLERLGIRARTIDASGLAMLREDALGADLIVDGILGLGVRLPLSEFLARVIGIINSSGKKIVACDIPSGLLPDEGDTCGSAVRADYTVSFLAPKKAFLTPRGKTFCGRVFIADIGVSKDMLERS